MAKKLLFILLLPILGFGQIDLEHIYAEATVTRIKLEVSGEKYYWFDRQEKKLHFFNADHTLWKTVDLAVPEDAYWGNLRVHSVSENKFNSDDNLEIAVTFSAASAGGQNGVVFDENGTILKSLPGAVEILLSELPGMPDKLITDYLVSNSPYVFDSAVFSMPDMNEEHVYEGTRVKRIGLENSGEKYYAIDSSNEMLRLYNSDHTVWKTVNMPKPEEAGYTNNIFITETHVNPDEQLEVGYTYVAESLVPENGPYVYESRVVNETATLITIPSASKLTLSTLPGLPDKLLSDDLTENIANVYTLPSLAVEHTYAYDSIERVKLENSGEKYYHRIYNGIAEGTVPIYNADHTLWKSIPTGIEEGLFITDISHLSETKIDDDNLVEMAFSYGNLDIYNTRIVNENGQVLLNEYNGLHLAVSELPGLPNKIIGSVLGSMENQFGKVYNLTNLGIDDLAAAAVVAYPNPASVLVNLKSEKADISEVVMYDLLGQRVNHVKANNIRNIDVSQLQTGMYFIDITTADGGKSIQKIMVSH